MTSSSEMSKDVPKPRLCHLVKWPDFDGYGFNLHAEKSKNGQFIGQVDDESPAESAGLKQGDRIIEVNGVNIANENHKQVVERIKAISNETKLLVLDEEADKYYKSKKILVKSSLPIVQRLKTAIPRPRAPNNRSTTAATIDNNEESKTDSIVRPTPTNGLNGENGHHHHTTDDVDEKTNGKIKDDSSETDERRSQNSLNLETSEKISTYDDKLSDNGSRRSSNRSTPSAGWKDDVSRSSSSSASSHENERKMHDDDIDVDSLDYESRESCESESKTARESPRPLTPPLTPIHSTSTTTTPSGGGGGTTTTNNGTATGTAQKNGNGLNLNMTAQQMRAMLANRKKYDPKKESMDLRKKHAIIQQM